MVIGITGPTGAGKTTALNVLKMMGFNVLDCDSIYHSLLDCSDELQNSLKRAFPDCVTNGRMDRRKLASAVFSDKLKLEELNKITHAAVKNEVVKQISLLPKEADVAIDAFALHDGKLDDLCEITYAILAPYEMRAERITKRDGISMDEALKRMSSQKPDKFYMDTCDRVIFNGSMSQEEFSNICADEFQRLRRKNNE